MKGLLRMLLFLVGAAAVAKGIELALSSPTGKRIATNAGLSELTTERGIDLAKRYARAVAGLVLTTIAAIQERTGARPPAPLTRAEPFSERVQVWGQLLLAGGSLAKTVSEFLEEREKLRTGTAAKP